MYVEVLIYRAHGVQIHTQWRVASGGMQDGRRGACVVDGVVAPSRMKQGVSMPANKHVKVCKKRLSWAMHV